MGPGPLCLRTGSPPPGTQDGGGLCGAEANSVCSQDGIVRKGKGVQAWGGGCPGVAVGLASCPWEVKQECVWRGARATDRVWGVRFSANSAQLPALRRPLPLFPQARILRRSRCSCLVPLFPRSP